MKETIEVSGGFPHHDSWKEWHWGEAIQVHKVWQELLIIKRIDNWSTTRGSMKDTTIEVHQMWQELFHIRWRFIKGITLERSHSIAQRSTGSKHFEYHQKIHEGNHWSLRRFSTSHCVAKARRLGSMFWFFSMIFFPAGWLGKFNIGPMQGRGVLKFRPEQPLTKEMGLPKFQLPST